MNTGQNYRAGDSHAKTNEPIAQNGLQTLPITGRRNILHVTDQQAIQWLDWLWCEDLLTDDERDWSKIIPITDNGMSPQLYVGEAVVAYLLDPSEYSEAKGHIVAFILKADKETNYVGRLEKLGRSTLTLRQDNRPYPERTIERKAINQLFRIVYTIAMPVL